MRVAAEPSSPVQKVWKPELYKIQLEAPTPKPLCCTRALPTITASDEDTTATATTSLDKYVSCYGNKYHGLMGHLEAEQLLAQTCDGTYLLRRSPNACDYATLSIRFNNRTKHFKVYYKPELGHYLLEHSKHYDSVHAMVADGLINFHIQLHAGPIIQQINQQTKNCYQQSPYMTLNRRKLRALSNELRKSIGNKATTTTTTSACTDTHDATNDTLTTTGAMPQNTAATGVINGLKNTATQTNTTTATSDDGTSAANSNKNTSTAIAAAAGSANDADPILPLVYEKPHHFKVHTFKGLNWCEFCANFLWGFTAQGVKCDACGFMAHVKCSELVPPKCVPDLKRIRGVFATDLTTMVQLHGCLIPFVVRRCVEEVEARGMLQEGIYRVSGFADEIDALKLALDRDGEKTDMSEAAYGNINVIAGTLKLYLRLLPLQLITFQAYPHFMAAARIAGHAEQLQQMKEAANKLPLAHYNCLKYMLEHLKRVASHYAANKMNEHNLATVFAPTLIATPQHMINLTEEIFMLSTLITNCEIIFI